jgi:hypothetical protein
MYAVVFTEVRQLLRAPGLVPVLISAVAIVASLFLFPLNIFMHAFRGNRLVRQVRDDLYRTVRHDIQAAARRWT